VYIRKEGSQSTNRDEGSYQLSHAYDRFPGMSTVRDLVLRKTAKSSASFF